MDIIKQKRKDTRYEDFLLSEIVEDYGITNLDVIDELYDMLLYFFESNNLKIDEESKLYKDFIKFVLEHTDID